MRMTSSDKLIVLLRDFGYEVQGSCIIQLGVQDWSARRVFGRCRSVLDAAEQLCPIIHDPEYTRRLAQITNPKE